MPKQTANKSEQNGYAFIGARVPQRIRAKLKQKAKRERRSVSAEIELALTMWTAAEP